ncbi:TIGR03790 family protein [Occallatibacter savannae]|uniref:TIGR03790 family protein n=1 Tax=Occallatibacter savannae TaxID=1002691 RepID=UPI000D686412|nr:TIGR03790 family protein [Occallatibacter savannae]
MRKQWPTLLILTLAAFVDAAPLPAAAPRHTADEVLVVYNADSPVSTAVAKFYARKRGVSKSVAVHCADSAISTANETILLADYEREIDGPVHAYLARHREINFIVLTKGVPIRIDGGATGSRDEHTTGTLHPSVDSYLAATGYGSIKRAVRISIHGSGADGFGWLNLYWNQNVPFSHAAFGGYLVTRLDGYTEADAEALVTRSLAADDAPSKQLPEAKVLLDVQPVFKFNSTDVNRQPLPVAGPILDESDYGSWNADMVKAGNLLVSRGIPTELDRSEAFIGNRSNLIGYFSWGSNDARYNGKAYESLRFAPGSIGDTAVSTSGRTFLPTTGGQSLIADLVAHGITGVKGYTDEPLLQAIASPSIAMERYTSGFTLAESMYAASRFVGWEDVVIGDPLCRAPAWMRKDANSRSHAKHH